MALSAAMEWDVRTTGSNSNGGGFKAGASGTDYSQQDSPQITFTDLVIDGTTNTKCTSAGNPFTSAHVGNVINITSGTGFTVQRVEIVSVASGVATCDKSLGTLGSTGGNGKLGGALLTIGQAISVMVTGNTCHIKSGTYTISSQQNISTASANFTYIGFGSAHNDGGTRPLFTTSTNTLIMFSCSSVSVIWRNINFSNTASGTRYSSFGTGGGGATLVFQDCNFDGPGQALYNGISAGWANFVNCEIKNCTDSGISSVSAVKVFGCYIHNNAVNGIYLTAVNTLIVVRSIIAANGANGIRTSGGGTFLSENSIAGNTNDGVLYTSASLLLVNNIIYGNGGYGFNNSSAAATYVNRRKNAYGANTSGALNNFTAESTQVTLTADPFTNSAGGDYSLNSTAGGGAACRDAGFSWA